MAKTNNIKYWGGYGEDMESRKLLYCSSGTVNWYNYFGKLALFSIVAYMNILAIPVLDTLQKCMHTV